MSACVITGGSGFIGTHLISLLKAKQAYDQVYVIDLKPPPAEFPDLTWISADIRQPLKWNPDVRIDVIYHLAALCKEPGYEWEEYFTTNAEGTQQVVRWADLHDIRNIVYISTMMVFRAGEQRMTENSLTAPDTGYGISKLHGEFILSGWAKQGNRRLRILRAGVVYGKGENGNFTKLYYALRKGLFVYIGKSSTVKGCIYVKDVADLVYFLAGDTHPYQVYNGADPGEWTIREICEAFMDVFQFRRIIPKVPYSLALAGGYFFEFLNHIGLLKSPVHHRRIQKLYYSTHMGAENLNSIGYKIRYPLKKGLEDWQKDCGSEKLH